MAEQVPSLGESEIQILRLVWRMQPCSERQITQVVQRDRSVARTTVLKTLQRLESKGLLRREPGDGPVRYRALVEERKVVPKLVSRFVDSVLGGSTDPLVAYLCDARKFSAADVAALRRIARNLREENGTQQ